MWLCVDYLAATLSVVRRESLIKELDRLVAAGEPLLAEFPLCEGKGYQLYLPDSISPEMRQYATEVSYREWGRTLPYEPYWFDREEYTTDALRGLVECYRAGLFGWTAVGVLRAGNLSPSDPRG